MVLPTALGNDAVPLSRAEPTPQGARNGLRMLPGTVLDSAAICPLCIFQSENAAAQAQAAGLPERPQWITNGPRFHCCAAHNSVAHVSLTGNARKLVPAGHVLPTCSTVPGVELSFERAASQCDWTPGSDPGEDDRGRPAQPSLRDVIDGHANATWQEISVVLASRSCPTTVALYNPARIDAAAGGQRWHTFGRGPARAHAPGIEGGCSMPAPAPPEWGDYDMRNMLGYAEGCGQAFTEVVFDRRAIGYSIEVVGHFRLRDVPEYELRRVAAITEDFDPRAVTQPILQEGSGPRVSPAVAALLA